MTKPPSEELLARRARLAKFVSVGQRVGYGLFALAIFLFFVGLFGTLSATLASAVVWCLLAGSVILAPAIVLGYAVKAAEREDKGLPSGH